MGDYGRLRGDDCKCVGMKQNDNCESASERRNIKNPMASAPDQHSHVCAEIKNSSQGLARKHDTFTASALVGACARPAMATDSVG